MNSNAQPQGLPGSLNRAKAILLSPHTEWPIIAAEPVTVVDLYKNYVLIIAAIPALMTLIMMATATRGVSLTMLLIAFGLPLVAPLILGFIIYALASAFGAVRNFVQALTVATYAYTAPCAASVLTVVPGLRLAGLAGALYCAYLLFLGLQYVMDVPASRAAPYAVVVVFGPFILIAALMMGIMALAFLG